MKYFCSTLSIIVIILSSNLYADDGWFWQYPSPQGNTLNDIFIIDKDIAVAVGDLGTVLKTIDGGTNWDVIDFSDGMSNDLQSVFFLNADTGWVTGTNYYKEGVLAKSDNGGNTWQVMNLGTTRPLYDIFFLDADTGFVCGEHGYVSKTNDGGANWISQCDNKFGKFKDVDFINKNIGWVVGSDGLILHTIDGGENWVQQPSNTDADLNSVYAIDESNIFIVGGGID